MVMRPYSRLRIWASAEGRHDDREAAMRKRLDVYARETVPVLDYYAQDKIADIDAMQHP